MWTHINFTLYQVLAEKYKKSNIPYATWFYLVFFFAWNSKVGVKPFFGFFSKIFTGKICFSRPLFSAFWTFLTPTFFFHALFLGFFHIFHGQKIWLHGHFFENFHGWDFYFTGTFLIFFHGWDSYFHAHYLVIELVDWEFEKKVEKFCSPRWF